MKEIQQDLPITPSTSDPVPDILFMPFVSLVPVKKLNEGVKEIKATETIDKS